MAGPVGHIICALALLNNTNTVVEDTNAYFLGNLDPDKRYISKLSRAETHNLEFGNIKDIIETNDAFLKGRKLHLWLDIDREAFMKEHNAYQMIQGPLKSQTLKAVEDHLLFPKLKEKFDSTRVFAQILSSEHQKGITQKELELWHEILSTYLNTESSQIARYVFSYVKILKAVDRTMNHKPLLERVWLKIKYSGFALKKVWQIYRLTKNDKLKNIIEDYYDKRLNEVFRAVSKEEKRSHQE